MASDIDDYGDNGDVS